MGPRQNLELKVVREQTMIRELTAEVGGATIARRIERCIGTAQNLGNPLAAHRRCTRSWDSWLRPGRVGQLTYTLWRYAQ